MAGQNEESRVTSFWYELELWEHLRSNRVSDSAFEVQALYVSLIPIAEL
jgi:hypothetical protein